MEKKCGECGKKIDCEKQFSKTPYKETFGGKAYCIGCNPITPMTKREFILKLLENAMKNQLYQVTRKKMFKGDYNPKIDISTEAEILVISITELFGIEKEMNTPSNQ